MNNIFTNKELILMWLSVKSEKRVILKELEFDEKDLEEIRGKYSFISEDNLREKNEILDHENLKLDIINSKKRNIEELEIIESKILKLVENQRD